MFKIITDNGSDLPRSYLEENGIDCLYLSTILDGKVIAGPGIDLNARDFYRLLSEGAKPSTSQINPSDAKDYFARHIEDSDEFLYIGLSSGLSGTVSSMTNGVAEVLEAHPNKKIEIVDSLAASIGQGIMVTHAVRMRNEGRSLTETAEWLRKNALGFNTIFTVDNLFDLWRGGRLSKGSAVLGTLIAVKPFMIVDDEGKLVVEKKLRGRKKALAYMVDYMEERLGSKKDMNDVIGICHGDCEEDAKYLEQLVTERLGFIRFLVSNVGPMIGTHTGASLVVLGFLGDNRKG
ncbi:MAG: DegV family protein [Lachnospiraceae bacterium]|nr:DegV family protein [Lachnospiraceae bacterium]